MSVSLKEGMSGSSNRVWWSGFSYYFWFLQDTLSLHFSIHKLTNDCTSCGRHHCAFPMEFVFVKCTNVFGAIRKVVNADTICPCIIIVTTFTLWQRKTFPNTSKKQGKSQAECHDQFSHRNKISRFLKCRQRVQIVRL